MEEQKSNLPEMPNDEWFKQVSEVLDSIAMSEQGSQAPNVNSSGNIYDRL